MESVFIIRKEIKVMAKLIDSFNKVDKTTKIYVILIMILATISILLGILVLDLSPVGVCGIVILEALLASLLNRMQLWIHGLIAMSQIVAGIITDKPAFMIIMVLFYSACTVFLFVLNIHESN